MLENASIFTDCISIRHKMLAFSLMALPTPSLYHISLHYYILQKLTHVWIFGSGFHDVPEVSVNYLKHSTFLGHLLHYIF